MNKYIAGSSVLFLVMVIAILMKYNLSKKNKSHNKKKDVELPFYNDNDHFDEIYGYGQFIAIDQ